FRAPLRDEDAIRKLAPPDPSAELRYVLEAVRATRQALGERVPLIGFAGSPFTLACYMVEGGGSDDWRILKTMLHARPDLLRRILEVNGRAVSDFLKAQNDPRAQGGILVDSWGGTVPHRRHRVFSPGHFPQGLGGVTRVPRILFTKG